MERDVGIQRGRHERVVIENGDVEHVSDPAARGAAWGWGAGPISPWVAAVGQAVRDRADCSARQLGAVAHPEPVHDVRAMAFDGLLKTQAGACAGGWGHGSIGANRVLTDRCRSTIRAIGVAMSLLTCRCCGFEREIRGSFLRIENCPRCLARDAIVTPMTLSSGPIIRRGSSSAGGPPPRPVNGREPSGAAHPSPPFGTPPGGKSLADDVWPRRRSWPS